MSFNLLNANPEKWSNTLKQIVGNLPTICLSVFDHFMNLALKGLRKKSEGSDDFSVNQLENDYTLMVFVTEKRSTKLNYFVNETFVMEINF